MPRRGHSTTIGKLGKIHRDRQRSEIRMLGEALRREQRTTTVEAAPPTEARESSGTR